jgi:hypothetical protein
MRLVASVMVVSRRPLDYSIVSGNKASAGREISSTLDGTISADNYNLFGYNSDAGVAGFAPGATDVVPGVGVWLPDILEPLADNGGDTETHALVFGSLALDAVDPTALTLPDFDQRGAGFDRVVNGLLDVGAYEFKVQPVGGFTAPASGLEQLAPATGLLAAIVALATSGVALVKRRKE